MAQATTLSPVDDVRTVAEVLRDLRDLVPDEFTALDYLAEMLLGAAARLEAREAA